jgi:hypothetical protein
MSYTQACAFWWKTVKHLLRRIAPTTTLPCTDENLCRNDSGHILTMAVERGRDAVGDFPLAGGAV